MAWQNRSRSSPRESLDRSRPGTTCDSGRVRSEISRTDLRLRPLVMCLAPVFPDGCGAHPSFTVNILGAKGHGLSPFQIVSV